MMNRLILVAALALAAGCGRKDNTRRAEQARCHVAICFALQQHNQGTAAEDHTHTNNYLKGGADPAAFFYSQPSTITDEQYNEIMRLHKDDVIKIWGGINQGGTMRSAAEVYYLNTKPTEVFATPDTQRLHWTAEKDWRREADRTGKPVFVFFTQRSGCPPCELIKQRVLPNQDVIENLNRFIYVKIEDPQRMRAWRINATPQGLFVDPKTKFVVKIGGKRQFIMSTNPDDFGNRLNRGYWAVKYLRGTYEDSHKLDRTTGHGGNTGYLAGIGPDFRDAYRR